MAVLLLSLAWFTGIIAAALGVGWLWPAVLPAVLIVTIVIVLAGLASRNRKVASRAVLIALVTIGAMLRYDASHTVNGLAGNETLFGS